MREPKYVMDNGLLAGAPAHAIVLKGVDEPDLGLCGSYNRHRINHPLFKRHAS